MGIKSLMQQMDGAVTTVNSAAGGSPTSALWPTTRLTRGRRNAGVHTERDATLKNSGEGEAAAAAAAALCLQRIVEARKARHRTINFS